MKKLFCILLILLFCSNTALAAPQVKTAQTPETKETIVEIEAETPENQSENTQTTEIQTEKNTEEQSTETTETEPENTPAETAEDPEPQDSPKSDNTFDPWKNLKGLQELFSYNLFTGEANFNFPISLPKGRNGLTPDLSVNYSHFNKNLLSKIGFGFSISENSIYRASTHGIKDMYTRHDFVIKLQGKYAELVLVDSNQGLYMDKNGANVNKYYFNNNTWTIKDTSGTTYYFGPDLNSRQFDSEDSNRIFQWMLTKIENTNGDKIEFTYFSDLNQIYLDKIKYGYFGNQNIYEIDLDYTLKNAYSESYQAGFKIQNRYITDKIYVNYFKETWKNFKTYTFSYDDLNKAAPKLIKIQEKGGNITLPAIEFEYFSSTGAANLLQKIKNNNGGEINLTYLPSAKYIDNQTGEKNKIPFILQTLHKVEYKDLIKNLISTKTFDYIGAHYYYDSEDLFGRQYAGFNIVTTTDDEGYITKSYFH